MTPTFAEKADYFDSNFFDPTLEKNHLIQFYMNEANFNNFLDLKILLDHYSTLNYLENDVALDIQELAICTISILIELKQNEEASGLVDRCEKFARHYNLEPLIAKIIILRVFNFTRKKDSSIDEIEDKIQMLDEARRIIKDS